jgi:tRNA-specific 2-thiouridylase
VGKQKIVVAMSGGVDSSVAAGILVREGYEVIGITIKTYRYEDVGGNTGNESSCCSLDGINDARAVAALFGFPHYVLDFSERFGADVIENFVQEYLEGKTPNPCVRCNRKIKWEEIIRTSVSLGAGRIATGHYARVRNEGGRYLLARGTDRAKDQSYALWGLTQDSLRRTLFPLSEMTKPQVRELASSMGLPTAGKVESFEICFIPDNNYERFLKERDPSLEGRVAGGEVILDGKVVGTHRGYPFYTIGQRKGLGLAAGEPVYVTGIDAARNRIELGREADLLHRGLVGRECNLIKYEALPGPLRVRARIRYMDPGGDATVTPLGGGKVRVVFDEMRRAITPGQSVVLYEGDDVVGGAIIESVLTDGVASPNDESREER